MRHVQEGLLAQIEAGVLDDTVPLASLLQKCIVLGGQAGSEKMRDWARQELNGYPDADSVPDYRRIPAPMTIRITNRAGYNPITQQVYTSQLPDAFTKKYDVEVAILGGGIGELEALANKGENEHHLSPGWSSLLVELLNRFGVDAATSHVTHAYWSVSNVSIVGLLVRVRTALAELVAELISLTPEGQTVPDKRAADQAVQFVITGDRNTINYSPQHATDGGTNTVTVGTPTAGPVTVSGAYGTAIGSQTANGANSTMVGSQAVQGDHNAVAGQAGTIVGSKEQPVKEGWWARLRRRGVLVAVATVVAAVVAVFAWIGWTPWS